MQRIDLRSDTVTLPSDAMRAAMASAPVGDDQYGEDPTVRALQDRIAALLGKEAAVFVPSGTMANQIGLKLLTRPGDDVVVGDEAHIVWHESGAAAANRELVDMRPRDVTITVDLNAGVEGATVRTTDLTAAYVHENSAYST